MFSLHRRLWAAVALAAAHQFVAQAPAAPPTTTLERALFPPSPGNQGGFGYSLNTMEDDLLVGEPGRQRVHLYSFPAADLLTTFISPDASTTAISFGRVTTQWKGNVVISDFESNAGAVRSGSAYLFDTAGNHLATIPNPSPETFGYFGYSAAAVGERLFLTAGNGDGVVYGYDSAEASSALEIRNPQFQSDGHFGIELERYGDSLLVGAPLNQSGGVPYAGIAYRFDAQTGALEWAIDNPEPGDNGKFGWAMDISGDRLLVGAPGLSIDGANHSGAAYVFDALTGDLLQTLRNPVPRDSASFGEAVTILDKFAFVAAPGAFVGDIWHAGMVYQFDLASGQLLGQFHSPWPEHNGYFGESSGAQNGGLLAMGDRLIVGASRNNTSGLANAGAALIYVVPEPPTLALLAASGAALVISLSRRASKSASTRRTGRQRGRR